MAGSGSSEVLVREGREDRDASKGCTTSLADCLLRYMRLLPNTRIDNSFQGIVRNTAIL